MQDTPITENTNTFDSVALWYSKHLSSAMVRSAASYDKRAQDKTTVRTSEFSFRSDSLSLSQTEQPDNVLAVTTPHFSNNALGRVIRKDRLDSTRAAIEYVYDDSQSDTNPRNGHCATSMYRIATTNSVAPLSTIEYDRENRARTVGFDARITSYPAGNGLRMNNVFDANRTRERIYVTPTSGGGNLSDHRYKFYSFSNQTHPPRTSSLSTFTIQNSLFVPPRAKPIFYDRLNRLTDDTKVGASTAAIRCDALGATTNRTPYSGLGDLSAYFSSGTADVPVGIAEPMNTL